MLFYFDTSATKLRIKLKGGGWDKISEIAGRKGEPVKFKIFAIPWLDVYKRQVLVIDSGSDRLAELLSRDTKIGIVSRGSLAALGTADEISAGSITDSTEYEIILACKPDDDTVKSAEAVLDVYKRQALKSFSR